MAFLEPPTISPSQLTLGEDSQLPHPATTSTSKDLAKDQERTQSAVSSTTVCRPQTAAQVASAHSVENLFECHHGNQDDIKLSWVVLSELRKFSESFFFNMVKNQIYSSERWFKNPYILASTLQWLLKTKCWSKNAPRLHILQKFSSSNLILGQLN